MTELTNKEQDYDEINPKDINKIEMKISDLIMNKQEKIEKYDSEEEKENEGQLLFNKTYPIHSSEENRKIDDFNNKTYSGHYENILTFNPDDEKMNESCRFDNNDHIMEKIDVEKKIYTKPYKNEKSFHTHIDSSCFSSIIQNLKMIKTKFLNLYIQLDNYIDYLHDLDNKEYKDINDIDKRQFEIYSFKEEINKVLDKYIKSLSIKNRGSNESNEKHYNQFESYTCIKCLSNSNSSDIYQYENLVRELYNKNRLLQNKLIKYKNIVDENKYSLNINQKSEFGSFNERFK